MPDSMNFVRCGGFVLQPTKGGRNMRTIGKAIRTAICGTALMLMAVPGISAAAEHGGMGGMQHGDHGGMKMDDPGKMKSGGHDVKNGEKISAGGALNPLEEVQSEQWDPYPVSEVMRVEEVARP